MISRNSGFAVLVFAALTIAGRAASPTLTISDVNTIIGQAVQVAKITSPNSVIAVTDREGYVLGVYGVSAQPGPTSTDLTTANAIAKAGTAAYLSSNGEAFTSRTAGFIIQPHFPPGITNTGTGPLVGVGLSSLPFSDINHFRNPAAPALGIPNTSLSGNPGGVPIYKNGILVGGVGVDSNSAFAAFTYVPGPDLDENIAVVAQSGYGPPSGILATNVLLNGIRLPYTDFTGGSQGVAVLNPANFAADYPPTNSPGAPFNPVTPSPFPNGNPAGEVRNPIISSPLYTPTNGRLSATEVQAILFNAAARAAQTRGAIRNPAGSPAAVFVVVIDYYTTTAVPNAPVVLGSFRTSDATIFSYDVAAQKARTALFFSNNNMAMSSRAVGFLAQPTYPPGIDGTVAGPYFNLQNAVSLLPSGATPAAPINGYLPNGITIFPGGFPLYRHGVLIGAIGVSGDGVDQDDLIAAAGTVGFEAPSSIRADQFAYRGARLPYVKFPQNASL